MHEQTTDSQNSSRLKLGGSHHLPPYSILYVWPWGLHPNVILSKDSQVGNPEIPKMGGAFFKLNSMTTQTKAP